MSGPVDVLAVLQYHAIGLRDAPRLTRKQAGKVADELAKASAAVAELIERLEASNWRLAELLALIPTGRPERAQIEHDMADNRAAIARAGGAA